MNCPGCGLDMPPRPGLTTHAYINASPECWSVFNEVLAAEYSNALIFGRVHQLTVDAYAVQHPGGAHPDKSMDIHLVGLYLAFEGDVAPPEMPQLRQKLAESTQEWPHFEPPQVNWSTTICDVALVAGEFEAHVEAVRKWAREVWDAWAESHVAVRDLAARLA